MNNTQTITGADLLTLYPKCRRSIEMAYKEFAGESFKINAPVAPEIIAQLDAKWLREKNAAPAKIARKTYAKSSRETAQHVTFARNDTKEIARNIAPDCAKETAQIAQVVAPEIARSFAPVEVAQPAQTETSEGEISRNWLDVLGDIICIGIVLFIAGLVAYDCALLWKTPGIIGGSAAFLVQCLALLYSTNPNKTRTSETAILVVALVDVLAWFVHYPAFMKNADDSASTLTTGVLCGVLCLFSFMASYLYRDSKII